MTRDIIAVTGGRHYDARAVLYAVLDEEYETYCFSALVQGECPSGGADRLAKDWCFRRGVPCIGFPALWDFYGKPAGPMRNRWMLDLLPVFKLIAFPGNRGTASAMEEAEKRDILVRDVTVSPPLNGAS